MSSPSSPRFTYRILHFTDIHYLVKPSFNQIINQPKRLIGWFNLFVLGRARAFDRSVQLSLANEVKRHSIDRLIITGDSTSLATQDEFDLATQSMQSMMQSVDTSIIQGNHDVYTGESILHHMFERAFGKWHEKPGVLKTIHQSNNQTINLLALDPCRPTSFVSNGLYPEQQLEDLKQTLSQHQDAINQSNNQINSHPPFLVMLTHYPLLDASGRDYQTVYQWHGAKNNSKLLDILRTFNRSNKQTNQPSNNQTINQSNMMILHGHVHHGYHSQLQMNQSNNQSNNQYIPIYNPGSAGRSFSKGKRAAAYNLYTIEKIDPKQSNNQSNQSNESNQANNQTITSKHIHTMFGWRVMCERYVHNGAEFVKEDEPYTTPS